MSPQIFITGISGYVGGTTVDALIKKHPDYKIVGLVRSEESARLVKARWSHVETVIGSLDTPDVLIEQASKSDVTLEMASSDHPAGAEALIKGLSKRLGGHGYLIHMSGTGVLIDCSSTPGAGPTPGKTSYKIYNDVKDVMEITSLGPNYLHGPCDLSVLNTGKELKVPTAIICPPLIYGIGKGPVNTRNGQLPFLGEAIQKRGKSFTVNDGKDYFDYVHVDDVADALILLTEEALKSNGGEATWGPEGYYFCEAGELTWDEATPIATNVLHRKGAIKTTNIDKISAEEALALHPAALIAWGSNARSRAERLRALGWTPKAKGWKECMDEIMDVEIERFEKGGK